MFVVKDHNWRTIGNDMHDLKSLIMKRSIMLVSLWQWFPFYRDHEWGYRVNGWNACEAPLYSVSLVQEQKRSLLLS